jgi:hypothetical protein
MTHVYSDLLFDDRSLLPLAIDRHRGMTVTLLTALDLPWVADGHQRDGEHVRQPVDDRLRELVTSGSALSAIKEHLQALKVETLQRPRRERRAPFRSSDRGLLAGTGMKFRMPGESIG